LGIAVIDPTMFLFGGMWILGLWIWKVKGDREEKISLGGGGECDRNTLYNSLRELIKI